MSSPSISRVLSCLQAGVNDHLSSPAVAHRVKRVKRPAGGSPLAQISLQLTGFTSSARHHASLRALTSLLSPLPRTFFFDFSVSSLCDESKKKVRGGFVSVALSLGSPPVAVSDCHVLCCPDFPPRSEPPFRICPADA